jgi:predicted metal-binding protein
MINNCNYDLLETISIISKSLYRYDTYMKDASDCNCRSCEEIWTKIKHNREEELKMLLNELKSQVEKGQFSFEERYAA